MLVFLDFEASSLAKQSYPIEVAWVFADGRSETHLIRPAPSWTDWHEDAEAIHHISRSTLLSAGEPHDVVAQRMIDVLSGHDLLASAPSWDGKWLSVLLRGAGLGRRALRLRDTDDAIDEDARMILAPSVPPDLLDATVENLVTLIEMRARAARRQRIEHWRTPRRSVNDGLRFEAPRRNWRSNTVVQADGVGASGHPSRGTTDI